MLLSYTIFDHNFFVCLIPLSSPLTINTFTKPGNAYKVLLMLFLKPHQSIATGKKQFLPEEKVKALMYQLVKSVEHMHR